MFEDQMPLLQYQQISTPLVARAAVSRYAQAVTWSRSYQVSERKQDCFQGLSRKNCKWESLFCWCRADVQLRGGNCNNHGSSSAEGSLEPERIPSLLLWVDWSALCGGHVPLYKSSHSWTQMLSWDRAYLFSSSWHILCQSFSGLVVDQPLDYLHRACIQPTRAFHEPLCLSSCTLKYLLYWGFWRWWFLHPFWFPSWRGEVPLVAFPSQEVIQCIPSNIKGHWITLNLISFQVTYRHNCESDFSCPND